MIDWISNDRINELTQKIVLEHARRCKIKTNQMICVDLEGIATQSLGLEIYNEDIVDDDPDIVAFSANGTTPINVLRSGTVQPVIFSDRAIVLDKLFLRADCSVQRRFTLAHEIGHKIYDKIACGNAHGCYRTLVRTDMTYAYEEYRKRLHPIEAQATNLGCALMMPKFLLENTLKRVMHMNYFPIYGERQILPKDNEKLKQMAEALGVSPYMLWIQLRVHKLLEYFPIEEYLKITGLIGGE